MKPEELDRLYKRTFDQYKGEVPAELWEDIAPEIGPKRGRRGFIWFIGGIFMLGAGLLAGQTFLTSPSEKKPTSKTLGISNNSEKRILPNTSKSTATANTYSPSSKVLSSTPDISMLSISSRAIPVMDNRQTLLENLPSPHENRISPIRLESLSIPIHVSIPTRLSQEQRGFTFRLETSQLKGHFYAEVSPFLAYHHIHPNLADNVFTSFPSLQDDFSPQRAGLSAEIGFIQPLSSRIYLKGGLSSMYYRQNFNLEQTTFSGYNLVSGSDLKTGVTLKPVFSQPKEETIELETLDLGIHTSLGFRLGNQPTAAVIETGLKTYFPLNSRYLGIQGEDGFSDGRISYAIAINGRIPVALSPSSKLMIGPSLTYGLTNWSFQEGPFSVRPYQVGIGFTYIFLSGL